MKLRRIHFLGPLLLLGVATTACSGGEEDFGATGDTGGTASNCDPISRAANLDCEVETVKTALNIVNGMSLEEKVLQMSGPASNPNNMFDQADDERLGIPGFKYMDGPRGVRWYNTDYGTTVYPVAAARAATFDIDLERKIGRMMAKEMRYLGRHILLAPTINQVTHPRWGRAQESYGEDSWLLGEMGASFIEGAQYDPTVPSDDEPDADLEDTYRIMACVKHFAANNVEDPRIYVNAVLDERTLREVYLPHFQKAIDAGVACTMGSYNRVNGDYACYSKPLIRDILKGEWGYDGFVISDWFAKGNTLSSPVAGLDIEMPFSSGTFPSLFDSKFFYGTQLTSAVKEGQVDEDLVTESALRIVHKKFEYGLMDFDVQWTPWLTIGDEAQELALQAAREGIVLLKNGPTEALDDDVLPIDPSSMSKIAVVGKFSKSENMGDKGSSDAKVMDGDLVITPYEGIADAFDGATMLNYDQLAGNEAEVADADMIVVVGAYYYADLNRSDTGEEGEWKDRESLDLPQRDLDNINAAIALRQNNPDLKIVVVTKAGAAVHVADWKDDVDVIIHAWYAGMLEGQALAEIMTGAVNPSGHLVVTFPKSESDLPAYDTTNTEDMVYDYYHGYRYMDKHAVAPEYPFGYGLSFTTFTYGNLTVAQSEIAEDGTLEVSVDVTNSGSVAGSDVVQLYVGYSNTAVADQWGRPVKELRAFDRVHDLAPGETRTVTMHVDAADLAYWNTETQAWTVEKMAYELFVGPSADSNDVNMQQATFTVN